MGATSMLRAMKFVGWFAALLALLIGGTLLIPPFAPQKMRQLRRGLTPAEVEAIMGKPNQKNGKIWYYNPRRPSFDVFILDFDDANQLQNFFVD